MYVMQLSIAEAGCWMPLARSLSLSVECYCYWKEAPPCFISRSSSPGVAWHGVVRLQCGDAMRSAVCERRCVLALTAPLQSLGVVATTDAFAVDEDLRDGTNARDPA